MHPQSDPSGALTSAVTPCWNTIGARGDRSCPELAAHIHCHNCPTYANGAAALLDRPAPEGLASDRAEHFAKAKAADERDAPSVVIFRIGPEWFALATSVVAEVAERRAIHSVPHKRGGIVLGIANVRGELLVCVSLPRLIGLESQESTSGPHRAGHDRLLVVRGDGVRAVLPADEVCGIERFHSRELREVPTTVSKAPTSHTKAVVSWQGHVVGLLDDERLLRTLDRSLG